MASPALPNAINASPCVRDLNTAVSNLGDQCTRDSRFSFFAVTDKPTPSQITHVCMSPACAQVLSAIRQAVPTECSIPRKDQVFQLYKDIMDPIAAVCSKASVVITGPPMASSNATDVNSSSSIFPCNKVFQDARAAPSSVQCVLKSGYSFITIPSLPSGSDLAKICASANCTQTIAAIKAATPNECMTGGLLRDEFKLYEQILNPIDAACKTPSPTASASAEASPSPALSAPTTLAPATVVPMPSPKSAAPKSQRSALLVAVAAMVALAQISC